MASVAVKLRLTPSGVLDEKAAPFPGLLSAMFGAVASDVKFLVSELLGAPDWSLQLMDQLCLPSGTVIRKLLGVLFDTLELVAFRAPSRYIEQFIGGTLLVALNVKLIEAELVRLASLGSMMLTLGGLLLFCNMA
jgi:hypothetical protein